MQNVTIRIIAELTRVRCTVKARGGRLIVRPSERITPELREAIAAHRDEIFQAVSEFPQAAFLVAALATELERLGHKEAADQLIDRWSMEAYELQCRHLDDEEYARWDAEEGASDAIFEQLAAAIH